MEKLSKLLNEYLESKKKDIQQFMNIAALMTQSGSKLYQTYIISKDFKFIKRLVDNDKIDLWKIKKLYRKSNEHSTSTYPVMYEYSDLECLLMLLSISNSPIDDLISYLK